MLQKRCNGVQPFTVVVSIQFNLRHPREPRSNSRRGTLYILPIWPKRKCVVLARGGGATYICWHLSACFGTSHIFVLSQTEEYTPEISHFIFPDTNIVLRRENVKNAHLVNFGFIARHTKARKGLSKHPFCTGMPIWPSFFFTDPLGPPKIRIFWSAGPLSRTSDGHRERSCCETWK